MHLQLLELIGQKIIHDNKPCILIEVIDDGPLLVFQCPNNTDNKKQIQHDQHGNAKRRTLATFTIHCLNEMKNDLHPVLKQLLNQKQQQHLLDELL